MAFASSPELEWVAMFSSIVYVYLAAKGNIWCWLSGFLSCLLFTFVFLYQQVHTQIILNILYMLMAIWGWIMWMEPKREGHPSEFEVWPLKQHLSTNAGLLALAYLLYIVVPQWFGHQSILLEIILVLGSVFATITTIYKVVESWIYWLVLDLLGVYLYWQGGSINLAYFVIHALLAVYGLVLWRQYRHDDIENVSALHS